MPSLSVLTPGMWQLFLQANGGLEAIAKAYDEDALGTVVSQFLNGTSTGLALFNPVLNTSGHIYYNNSTPPYTEYIQATVAIPVYITGVEVGSPPGGGALASRDIPVAPSHLSGALS